jgi:hypothetical protein
MEVLRADRRPSVLRRRDDTGRVDGLLRRASRATFRRAVRADGREWAYAAALVASIRLLRVLVKPSPRVVFRARLDPGDRVEIRAMPRG